MFNIEKVDSFPEISRSGRTSEELQMIVSSLKSSAENGERYCISGITKGNAYNSMQQRIRAQSKKMNLKVVIRFDAEAEKLYFKAHHMNDESPVVEIAALNQQKTSVKSSQVKGIKTVAKEKEEAV
jgi:formate-dependent phosphoribosylglycinamide formyltransferase (GAR transformylase)